MTWFERNTDVYHIDNLPLWDDAKVTTIDPSRVRVVIPGYKYPADIGSWCYLSRRKKGGDTTSEDCAIALVDIESFHPPREQNS